MNPSCLTFITLLFGTLLCYGQRSSVSGRVYTESGEGLPGVYLQLDEGQTTVSDDMGEFSFRNLRPGKHVLKASMIGFEVSVRTFQIAGSERLSLDFILKDRITELDEVTVVGESEARVLKEGVASVAVLEAKELYAHDNNTSDVIKRISGVNVRQMGGYGSDVQVYINGMSGKQVKFFLDGIPLSYFGSGLGLNVLPVTLMEQIEVYKGTVPVDLGADALGGGINIISRKEYGSYLDFAYSLGSFNSHKANLNGQWAHPDHHLLIGINSFYNHSDNSYPVEVEVPGEYGNPEPMTVRRFHDRFSNYLLNLYAGVYDKPYADRLLLSVRQSGLNDEVQHNAIMTQPYGEAVYEESTQGMSLQYEKEGILPGTALKWYGGLNQTKGEFIDTTLNAYTWDGKVYWRRTDGGELSASRNLLEMRSVNAMSRFNVHYRPWDNGRITLNVFSSWFRRTGKDPMVAAFYGQDYYAHPTVLLKNAVGIAYRHDLGGAWASYTALKHFSYRADGYAIQNSEFLPNRQSVSNLGYSQSFRYRFTDRLLAKTSYEHATRLPDELELFGDFTLVRPNPFLAPEKSHNINLGLQYRSPKLEMGLSGFYRLTDNIIWLRTSQFFAQYQNLLKAMIKGLEVEVQYQPLGFIGIKANATYQDIRNRSPKDITASVDDRYFNARLPNIPYLFGNGQVTYQKEGLMGGKGRLSAWWSCSYVHEFFLFWAVDGNKDLKNSIPAQFIQNIGCSYALPEDRLSITLESTNAFDRKSYDNFSIQRPGRAFHITLRTYINRK